MFANIELYGIDAKRQRVLKSIKAVFESFVRGATMSDDIKRIVCGGPQRFLKSSAVGAGLCI
jgi:hypothetical protein